MRLRWLGIVAVVALMLSGCAVRFVYNQLDWLVPWYLDDYMQLEGPQKTLFKQRLDTYLAWHRKEQLPLYADFLDQVAGRAEKGMSHDDIAHIQARTEQLAQVMIDRLKPDMMELFAMANDEQVASLFRKFEEDNAKYLKENVKVSPGKQRRQRQQEVINYTERWTGSLDEKQRKLIADWSKRFELMQQEVFDTRLLWQQEFKRILALRADRPAYEQAFTQLLDNPGFGQSDELKRKLAVNQALLVDLYLELEQSLSKDQRASMVKKLKDYAKDFRELSKQPQ
ncbi:MAG TPA: DUF6279 family lipoprotein [Dongiaceae bacterium]|nr:DUF6279 family lipoprotein [Dongiaceae bacterium]